MFVLALIILALSIMALGDGSNLFRAEAKYIVIFPSVEGMGVGSPVKMNGVQIGAVTAISLPKDPSRSGIEVQFGVDADYRARIRADSTAALSILQLLSGEKFIELFPGSPDQAELPENSEVGLRQDPEMFDQMAAASQNINLISVSLRNILASLEAGDGILGQMISDPDFGKDGLASLHGALTNLEGLTADLRSGKGFVGRLIKDEDFATKIDSLGDAIEGLALIVQQIDVEQGALGEMLNEDGSGKQAVLDLAEAAASLKKVTASLASDRGLVGRLLNDEAYSEKLAGDLERMVGNFAEISDKINHGDGTLGRLVNERTLHDGLEDVVAGVNDSKFARWLMRHYQKKGIKSPPEESGTGD
jgi:phospholipid/cholesterol/gamma-HCH transport system substrate-binding protein